MLFNSLTFALFFAIVFALHGLLRGWGARKNLLLAASYVFYAAWDPPYVFILAFSTTMDWWLARRIDRSDDSRARRAWLLLSLACNLTLLGYFKYGGFALENFQWLAASMGVQYQPPAWNIVLPVGISFYTFASLSYTIDVYRREIRADASLRDYALFVSFFPHLVAGPIVRASLLLPQLAVPRVATAAQVNWGLCLVVIGLFGKIVLADALFAPIVDSVYAAPAQYGAVDAWAAVLGFSGQIYFDFSAYSLCAIGLALCFGFEFPDNFRAPYAALGFSDFWRRWHISLSSWLRDYLYIPLGGNRGTETRTRINLLLTMLLGGLWHGASWLFVLWGGLHGLYLLLGRAFARDGDAPPRWPLAGILATFAVVTLTWIPFRADTLANAGAMLAGLVRADATLQLDLGQRVALFAGVAAMLRWQVHLRDESLESVFAREPITVRIAWMTIALLGIYLFSGGDERAFIYFQF